MEIVIAAIAGLFLGHVADLVFYRFYTDEAVSGPLSRCHECKGPFRLAFALPLTGFALNGGRCPDCGVRLPLRSIALPVGSAALFVASALVFDDLGPALLGGFFCTVFLTLTLTDFDRRLLPNRIVYPSILIAIAVSWAWPDSSALEVLSGGLVAIAIAAALLIFSLPFGGGAFGMGDVKMIVLIGFVVGLPSVLVGVVLGTIVAAVASAFLILTGIRGRKDYIPHGPFLALGAVIALFWGEEIWDAYRGN
jgi:prepilin signal peptidase PulO-like enzyme (type II secretory pathway)